MAANSFGGDGHGVAGGGAPGGGARFGRARPVWESSQPSASEVEEMTRRFPEVVVVPEESLSAELTVWAETAVVGRSLGRRVSTEAVLREIRRRAGLRGEITGSYIDKGNFLLKFSDKAERDSALLWPMTVGGQALALEPWRPLLLPSEDAVGTARVWLRLPGLPVEFWSSEVLREIVRPLGELLAVDDWTASRRRLGFARLCVLISLSLPLRPGVQIRAGAGTFWQSFVFENLDGVCLRCGRFHSHGPCSGDVSQPAADVMSASNLAQHSEGGVQGEGAGNVLGPWSLAVRRWVPDSGPRKPAHAAPPARRPGKEPSSASDAPFHRQGGEVPDEGGWVKPSKLARRHLAIPQNRLDGGAGSKGGSGLPVGGFRVLAGQASDPVGEEPGQGLLPVNSGGEGEGDGLTRSTRLPTPVTQGAGRELVSTTSSQLRVGGLGPVNSKRARSENGPTGRPTDPSVPLARQGRRAVTQANARKPSSSAATVPTSPFRKQALAEDGSSGLFVFEAGESSLADQERRGSSAVKDMALDHDLVVKSVQSALQGGEGVTSPMDACAADATVEVQSAGNGDTVSPTT